NSDTVSRVTSTSSAPPATAGATSYATPSRHAARPIFANYTISLAGGTLSVNPALLTITASNQSKTYGQTLGLGTTGFTTTGLVNSDTLSSVPSASSGAPSTAGAGSYTITPSNPLGSAL